jgi:phosphopantothenoylcysteine decarboxylase/phosphopantothenate--cysteine ligase
LILLAIGPGPGALRASEIIRELAAAGHSVEVVLQPNTKYFVGPAAFMALAPVVDEPTEPPEAVIFAPAGASELARRARGLNDGVVAEYLYSSSDRPVVVAPELDEATREHPAVRENVRLLREDGRRILEGSGDAMVSPLAVANGALNALSGPMSGLGVLVTAGGTREPIDKVRFIGNRSSGKMGRAVAREALRRGAEVTVVAASVEEKEPGTRWVDVESYAELEEATVRFAGEVDALVMAAAVSDFTPAEIVEGKIRRGGSKELELKLVATGDILKAVRESNSELFMVGFAATHGDPVADAREKLESKNVDLVVGNDVSLSGSGFSSDENEVHIVGRSGEQFVSRAPKTEVARAILDALTREIGEKEARKD